MSIHTHPSKHKFIVEDERWTKTSPQFLLQTHHSYVFLCISAVSISIKVIKKHNPKAFIWANVYTDTMFPRAFFIPTMGRQKITSSQEHTSIFTHRLRAYSWFAALPNTRAIIVNMKSATGMKPSWSYFFLGEAKLPLCWVSPVDTPRCCCIYLTSRRVESGISPSSEGLEQCTFLGHGIHACIHSAISFEQHFNIPSPFQQTLWLLILIKNNY